MPAHVASPRTTLAVTDAIPPDRESALADDDHLALRLWLRLLTCANLIESQLGQRLREGFASSLPRFDLMAQLHRSGDGLRMNELSRRLMVTGGSITGLADQLEAEGLLERQPVANDRRATLLRLTALGRERFQRMATERESWVIDLFGHLSVNEQQVLRKTLGKLRDGLDAPSRARRGPVRPRPGEPR
jgi:DNA-binding MarR family transcriptional regulator